MSKKKDYVIEATVRIGVTATSLKQAIAFIENSEGAPIDNDGCILAVLCMRNVPKSEGC